MANGFQRDVTTSIPAGEVSAPVGGPNLAPLAQVASFIAGGIQRSRATAQEEEAFGLTEKAMETYRGALDQGQSVSTAQRLAGDVIRKGATNANVRKSAIGQFATSTGTTEGRALTSEALTERQREIARQQSEKAEAESFIRGSAKLDVTLKTKLISKFGQDQYNKMLRNDSTEQELEDMAVFTDQHNTTRQVMELTSKQLQQSNNLPQAKASAGLLFTELQSQINDEISVASQSLIDIQDQPSEQQVALSRQLKSNGVRLFQQAINETNRIYGILSSKTTNQKERDHIEKERLVRVTQFEKDQSNLEQFSDDQVKELSISLKSIQDSNKITYLKSMGSLAVMKDVLGERAMGEAFLLRQGNTPGFGKIMDELGKRALLAIGENGEVDLSAFNESIEKGFGDEDLMSESNVERRNELVNNWYTTFQSLVDQGISSKFTPAAQRKGTEQLISIFHAASAATDKNEVVRATDLLNSDSFKRFYKIADQDQKDQIDRFKTNFNGDAIIDRNVGIRSALAKDPSLYTYDSDKGRYKVADLVKSPEIGPFQPSTPNKRNEQKVVDRLNKRLDEMEASKHAQPFFKDMSRKEMADFLHEAMELPDVKVDGTLTKFSTDHAEAFIKEVPVEQVVDEERIRALSDDELTAKRAVEDLARFQKELQAGRFADKPEVQESLKGLQRQLNIASSGSTIDEELAQILQENPNLTFAEAKELQKKASK